MAAFLVLLSLLSVAWATPFSSPTGPFTIFERAVATSCGTTGVASCQNTSNIGTCCFEAPGGQLLQTQFWDTNPSLGPTDSWTIHGLWPDHCDGTWDEFCDSSREYTNIQSLLAAQASDTLAYMQQYWLDNSGDDESFWKHEWDKHGTCMSTLETSCLPSGSATGADAVAYFQSTVKLFKTLPTYTWLANAGITPSSSTTRTLSAVTSALRTASGGFTPALDCNGVTLNAISWYFNLKGSAIDGVFVPINAPKAGNCPSSGILYPPKSGSGGGGGGTLPAKATIRASRSGTLVGGLLSLATWSTQTLATYTITGTATSFTMTSSKGNCGVVSGTLTCGSGVSLSTFSATTSGTQLLLTYEDSTAWTSSGVPSGTIVFPVLPGSSLAQDYTLVIVST